MLNSFTKDARLTIFEVLYTVYSLKNHWLIENAQTRAELVQKWQSRSGDDNVTETALGQTGQGNNLQNAGNLAFFAQQGYHILTHISVMRESRFSCRQEKCQTLRNQS